MINPRLRVTPKKRPGMEDDASGCGSEEAEHAVRLSFNKMPPWFRVGNNEWVRSGYRPVSNSVRASFRSWWHLHNETINIYSHLIPAIAFFLGDWYILRYLAAEYPRVTGTDLVAFSCSMLSATVCYASSALYHTLMNHSRTVDRLCHRLDMAGIGIFITGDIVLGVYIIFWCETTLRNIYWAMVS